MITMNIIDEINEVVDQGKPVKLNRQVLYLLVLNALKLLISDVSFVFYNAIICLPFNIVLFNWNLNKLLIATLLTSVLQRLFAKEAFADLKIARSEIKVVIQFLKGKGIETSTK